MSGLITKIYCISLERREDRRIALLKRWEQFGYDIEFFMAKDKEVAPNELPWVPHKGSLLSPSQYACATSHILLLSSIASQHSDEYVLILEDDAVPCSDFMERLNSIDINTIPKDIDLLTVGHLFDKRTVENTNETTIEGYRWWSGAHAYIVSPKSSRLILDSIDTIWAPFDDMLASLTKLRIYHVIPSLVDQDVGFSDIDEKVINGRK